MSKVLTLVVFLIQKMIVVKESYFVYNDDFLPIFPILIL